MRRFLLLLVAGASMAQTPPARIKIDIDRTIGEVDPLLFGNFAEHLGRMIYGGIYEEGSPLSDAEGYRKVRGALADSYDIGSAEPDIQVVDVDLLGDRQLILRHAVRNGVRLAATSRDQVLRHIRRLWGYDVRLQETGADTDADSG